MKRLIAGTVATAALIAATLLGAAAAQAAQPLVGPDWLKAHLDDGNVVVLDIRWDGRDTYAAGHIPGAVYSNYAKAGWRTTDADGTPGQMPAINALEELIGGLGIDNDDHVIVVSGGTSALDMGSATRVYFTFKLLGHDEVSILDGGMKGYRANAANPVETGIVTPEPARFIASPRPELLADKEEVLAAVESGVQLVDNRPNNQYLGVLRHPRASRYGTIPGAVNLPENWLTVDNGGRFRDAAELAALQKSAGVAAQGAQINFCNTGHWASLGWFVSHELLGNEEAKLYDGSMVEWTADASLPVERKAPLN